MEPVTKKGIPAWSLWAVGCVLVLFRIPYYFTGHVQEDAFITFRCALNLARTGIYGYNAGEKVSGSTTHLYVFWVALLDKIGGGFHLPLVLAINTAFLVVGLYLLSGLLARDQGERLWLWVLITISPAALLISYSGMETSLLVLTVGLALTGYQRPASFTSAAAVALLPWIRPDAVAFAGMIIVLFTIKQRRLAWPTIAALGIGTASLIAFNFLYFGSVLNQTIIAKSIYYKVTNPLSLLRAFMIVFGIEHDVIGLYSPLRTKFLAPFSLFFLVGTLAGFAVFLFRSRSEPDRLLKGGWFVSAAILVPSAYAVGRVIFAWYLWPSELLGFMVVITLALDLTLATRKHVRRIILFALIAAQLALAAGQWAISFNTGTQESRYRTDVGE